MMELNKYIVAGLEQGKLQELLLGEREWFLPDNTFRNTHDIMLIMYVFLNWVKQLSNPQPVMQRFAPMLSKIAASNPWSCVDILLAYVITAKDNGIALPIELAPVLEVLRGSLTDDLNEERSAAEAIEHIERRLKEI